MTSSCSGKLMAAMTFMGSWQDGQSVGSTNHVFLMSRAQLRFRPLTNGLSSVPRGCDGSGGDLEAPDASDSGSVSAAAGTVSRGGLSTGGFSIQPAFLRNVVDIDPYERRVTW